VHKDNISGLRRRLRGSGVALDKSACRPRGHHAYEGASIHWMPLPKILAIHGSSPLRKIRVGYLRIAASVPATIVSVRNIVTDRCSVIAPTDQANGFHCRGELKSRAIATVGKHLPFVVAVRLCVAPMLG
jgi:hypothetical protein